MSQYLLKAGEISVVITGNVDIRLSYDNTSMKVSSIICMIRQRNIFLSKGLIAITFLTLDTDAGRISCFNLKCVFKAFETFNRLYCCTFTDLPVSSPKVCCRDAEHQQDEELQTSSNPQSCDILRGIFSAEGGDC